MSDDEPEAVCPDCHADLAAGDGHSTGCPMDIGDVDDDRPIAEERAVLGRMMLDPAAVGTAATILKGNHFGRPGHRDLFETILELWDRGDPTDPVSVVASLNGDRLVRVGGPFYVHGLIQDVPTTDNVGYYADLIYDRFWRADMANALNRAIGIVREGDAHQTPSNIEAISALLENALAGRSEADAGESGVWLHEAIEDEVAAWDDPEEEQGILSGFADFDEVVGGLRPGQLVIVAARPSVGKSVLSTDWGRYAAEHKQSVLLFSLEMSRRDVMQRLIAAKAKVRLSNIRHRTIGDEERDRMKRAAESLCDVTFRIEDGDAVSLAGIRAVARQMKRSHTGLDLMIVDYLQLLAAADSKVDRRVQVDAFSRGLKQLAKELGIPVVALAQLNRGPEQRSDKKPMLSDLREAGGQEQDADIVVLINRPDATDPEDPRAGEADLILAKHRNGAKATITVAHQLHYARFVDIARG